MSNFLKEMSEAGKKFDGGGGIGCVGSMKVEFGFHNYPKVKGSGLDFWFAWRPASDVDDMERAKLDCQAKLNEHKVNEQARFGIKITIFKDALTGPYSGDLTQFVAEWSRDGIIYQMVFDTLVENNIPVNEVFYGQAIYKADPYQVSLGEAGKTAKDKDDNLFNPPRYPTIRVPVKVFKDEADAKMFADGQRGNSTPDNSQWSELAITTYGPDMEGITSKADEIREWVKRVNKGEVMDGYPVEGFQPMNPPNAKRYIAQAWAIEPADIDQLIALSAPF